MPILLRDDDRVYFLHIMKTAGTTLNTILENRYRASAVCPAYHWYELLENSPGQMANYRLFRGHFNYSLERFLGRKPIYLTMLRDPVDRVLSHFAYAKQEPDYYLHRIVTEKSMTLEDFLENQATSAIASNFQLRSLILDCDIAELEQSIDPGPDYATAFEKALDGFPIELSDDQMIATAKERLSRFALVGLVERFNESMALLSYTLGWEPIDEYSSRNVNPRRIRREDVPAEIISEIHSRNQLDYQLYEYAQSLFEQRFSQMLNQVLHENYRHRLESSAPEAIHFTFDQPLNGVGWHDREFTPEQGAFRWTGPETRSTLNLRLVSVRDLTVQVRVIAGINQEVLDSLSLEANGTPIPLTKAQDGEGRILFEGLIRSELLWNSEQILRLCLSVSETIAPVSIALNTDQRALGVAVNLISLTPSTQTTPHAVGTSG